MQKTYYEEMVQNLEKIIEEENLSNKQVIIFGHSEASERMVDYLLERKIKPEAIADNNENKKGFCYKGVIINKPEDLLTKEKEPVVLVVSAAFESMKAQCMKLGISKIFQVVDYNSFTAYSLEEDIFTKKALRVVQGEAVWKKYDLETKDFILVCPYNAMGDVYQALSYLPYYLKKKGIQDYIVVVQGKACFQVAEMFTLKQIINLNKTDMESMIQYILLTRKGNTLIAHHDRPYTNKNILLSNYLPIDFYTHYKIGVYGLPASVSPVKPQFIKRNRKFPQIEKGKSVILSPYAKSVVNIPLNYWKNRAEKFNILGYRVYTNVIDEEQPIPGTKPFLYPIEDMVAAVEWAGYFVGIRSGLCDVISTANCKIEILFPDCIYSTTSMSVQQFFAMQREDL